MLSGGPSGDIPTPFAGHEERVRAEWIDYSGHMNIGYYLLPFENAARAFFRWLELSQAYRERTDHALFALESHLTFEHEAREGDLLRFESRLLDWRAKLLDVMHFMYDAREGHLAATNQVVYLHVDLNRRRAAPFSDAHQHRLARVLEAHSALPRPRQAGRSIGLDRERE